MVRLVDPSSNVFSNMLSFAIARIENFKNFVQKVKSIAVE